MNSLDAGKSPFFTYVHIACTFSIISYRYDAFTYGTTYLIRPIESNDPASSLFRACYMASGHLSHC